MCLYITVDEDSAKIPDVSIVEASAELLYGLVHQRYILTRAGLQAMVRAFAFVQLEMVTNKHRCIRQRNMRPGYLVRALGCIVEDATSSRVDGQIFQDWIPSNCTAPTATTCMCHQAVASRV